MMRRQMLALILSGATLLFGQFHVLLEETDGRAWLDAKKESAAINVTGLWQPDCPEATIKDCPKWESTAGGRIPLSQREGGRWVIGTGNGWDISGVVSGSEVYLLFSHEGKIAYSAKLTAEKPDLLTGVYSRGLLSSHSKPAVILSGLLPGTRAMRFSR